MGNYLARQRGDVLRIWEEGVYDLELSRLGKDLLDAQGCVLGGCDVGDIRVVERPLPPGHDVLHEVNSNTLVGWHVLVAVNSQKATQTLDQSLAAILLVDLLFALVLGSKALRCHLRVFLCSISLNHTELKTKPILF